MPLAPSVAAILPDPVADREVRASADVDKTARAGKAQDTRRTEYSCIRGCPHIRARTGGSLRATLQCGGGRY